jgi:hypothetical protein
MTDLVDDLRSAVMDAAAIEGLAPERGKRMALAVCLSIQREWGASRPYVRSARAHRDGEIVRAVARGETLERAARLTGVSVRTVRRALQRSSMGPVEWEL